MTFDDCLKFFDTYCDFCAIGMFAALILFVITNVFRNAYAKQNNQFRRCIDEILLHPDRKFSSVKLLPEEYSRQWRAFVNSGAAKPSKVMEFVEIPHRLSLLWLATLSLLAELCFGAGVFLLPDNRSIQLYFVVYVLLSVIAMLFVKHVNVVRQKSARRMFGKFVALANKTAEMPDATPSIDDAVKKIRRFSQCHPDDAALKNVADLLRRCGTDKSRTVEEQRKLNVAVNGLLQAYANKLRFS